MREEELRRVWKAEENAPFSGWDFSRLCGRYLEEPLPWDYREKVLDFLKPGVRLLDMCAGGGEFLLSLPHPKKQMAVAEGWEPNFALCQKRLSPLGIRVGFCACKPGETMPFEENAFDLVLNRHGSFDLEEVRRILRPGGFFVTQQVGGQNGRKLSRRLFPELDRPGESYNLENQSPAFQAAGFRITFQDQAYPVGRFLDVGALCYHAKHIPWEFPDFSVDRCFPQLLVLEREIEERGFVENQEHRFILIGKNQKK